MFGFSFPGLFACLALALRREDVGGWSGGREPFVFFVRSVAAMSRTLAGAVSFPALVAV